MLNFFAAAVTIVWVTSLGWASDWEEDSTDRVIGNYGGYVGQVYYPPQSSSESLEKPNNSWIEEEFMGQVPTGYSYFGQVPTLLCEDPQTFKEEEAEKTKRICDFYGFLNGTSKSGQFLPCDYMGQVVCNPESSKKEKEPKNTNAILLPGEDDSLGQIPEDYENLGQVTYQPKEKSNVLGFEIAEKTLKEEEEELNKKKSPLTEKTKGSETTVDTNFEEPLSPLIPLHRQHSKSEDNICLQCQEEECTCSRKSPERKKTEQSTFE